jgi:hypothetical protein
MANEIQISYATGQTLRAALYDADTTSATVGYVWDGTEYVAVGSLVGTDWRITLTEIGSTGEYRGDLPAELVGTPVRVKVMSGATPGIGDAEVAGGVIGAESGGGGLTEEEVQALIAAAISGAQVEGGGGLNPVQSDLTLVLRKGTQYAAANSRAAQWTIADWGGPSLSGLSVTLLFAKTSDVDAGDSTADLAINGTASNVDGDALFSVDITATNLDALDSVSASTPWFNYRYQLRLNLSGGAYHELVSNAATISPKFTAPA